MKQKLRVYGLCAALFFVPTVSSAGSAEEMFQKLQERVEALEKRNAELEEMVKGRVQPAPGSDGGALAERLKTLEEESKATAELRQDVMDYKQHARMIEKMSKVEIGGDLNLTVQGTINNNDNKAGGTSRGDKAEVSSSVGLHASIPIGELGKLYMRADVGQGEGVTRWLPPMFAGPNADLEFDDARVRLLEVWYQATIPLSDKTENGTYRDHLDINIGKMDQSVFFDANAVANYRNEQFMATIFENNIALEWGGANAFGPGIRLGYHHEVDEQHAGWYASLGLFEGSEDSTGDGTVDEDDIFQDVFDRPFIIGEVGLTKRFGGLEGNYRIYGWANKARHIEWNDTSNDNEENTGWGVSADQQVSENITLFTRYGMQDEKVATFDRTFSVGGQTLGAKWNRPDDVVAVAYGMTSPGHDFEKVAETHPDYGYKASENEHYFEAYYKIQVNDQLSVSPDIQYVMNPGGDDEKDDFLIYGLRMFATF